MSQFLEKMVQQWVYRLNIKFHKTKVMFICCKSETMNAESQSIEHMDSTYVTWSQRWLLS